MKKLSVKIISIALAICLLIGVVPMSIFAEESDNNVYVDVTLEADKTDYADSDRIAFNGAIVNSSSKDCDADVEISLYATPSIKLDTKSLKVNALAAGEAHDLTVEATAKRTHFGFSLVQAMYDIVTGYMYTIVLEIVSLFSSNYECVRVYIDGVPAAVMYKVDSSVVLGDGEADEPTDGNVEIDPSAFAFNENTQKYNIVVAVEQIEGTVKNYKDVDSLTFKVSDINNNLIDSGTIETAAAWSTKDIDFFVGENKLTVTATYEDGSKFSDSLIIDCYIDSYMDNVNIDTTTDTDGDGLVDYLEINYCNTDIEKTDSDLDGLTDYQECVMFKYNPLKSDSNNDGIKDNDEDYDEDEISNLDEINQGTDPTNKDSDLDDLTDKDELEIYKTNPLEKDTDKDGANDGEEVSIGSDPLIANTAFAEETSYGTVSEDSPVAVKVKTTVSGDQVGSLDISPVSYADNSFISPAIPGYLNSAYDITVDGEIDSAELIFTYDTSLGTIGEDFQPRIYYFNEETKTLEELPNQIVTEGQVSAIIPHFSKYILLNKVEFDKVWNDEIKPPLYEGEDNDNSLDIVFVIDYSYSMTWNDSSYLRKKVTNEFVNKLRTDSDKAAVISFISVPTVLCDLTNDKDEIKKAVNSIIDNDGYSANAGTNGSAGINAALNLLEDSSAPNKYIVFLTDGEDTTVSYSYTDLTSKAKNEGVKIYSIGLGTADENLLKSIANGTDGKYYKASNNVDLNDIYTSIESETVDLTTDTNNDGICDYYTKLIYDGILVLSNGSSEFKGIDFNYDENGNLSDDYDADGVKNGDELVIKETVNGVSVVMVSDPMMVYSDTDVLSDWDEHEKGSDPMIPSYQSYYVDYPLNDDNFTYVNVFNNEDKWWNTGARNTWSTITLNWSHEDESVRLLGSFLKEFSDLSSIEEVAENIKKEQAASFGAQVIAYLLDEDGLTEDVGNINDLAGPITQAVISVKKWISAGNSAQNLGLNHFSTLKAQLGLFKHSKVGAKWISKVDTIGKYATAGLTIVSEGLDVYDVCNTYSMLVSTADAFSKSIDILEYIRDNDEQKEKYVGRAADSVLKTLYNEYNNFLEWGSKEIAVATTENIASLGLALASMANPYIAAVTLIVSVLDMISPATEIAGATYYLYVVDEVVNAAKNLFQYNSKTNNYYNIENHKRRHIDLLIYARMYGGEFAKTITGNQHYWGLFNDDEIRQEYADAINEEYDELNLCLSKLMFS